MIGPIGKRDKSTEKVRVIIGMIRVVQRRERERTEEWKNKIEVQEAGELGAYEVEPG